MGHAITIGQTESGKTVWNKKLAGWYRSHGVGVIVLDPMSDAGWPADWKTADPEAFLAFVKDPDQCLQCALFVDEAGLAIGKFDAGFEWLTCQSRHHGHVCHLITQRAQQVSVNVRSQCSTLYAFNVNADDAKIYARDFNCPMVMDAPGLAQGEFIAASRFATPKRWRLWT